LYRSTRSIKDLNKIVLPEEGWALSYSGIDSTPHTESAYRLERDDEAGLFPSDQHAWAHVVTQALAGSTLHRDALACLRDHGPVDFARVLDNISSHQRISLISIGLTMSSDRVQTLLKEAA
jgi:hypothetical protein